MTLHDSLSTQTPDDDSIPFVVIDTNPDLPFSAKTTDVTIIDLSSLPARKRTSRNLLDDVETEAEISALFASVLVDNYNPENASISAPFCLELGDQS
jgi:hypothetical protein